MHKKEENLNTASGLRIVMTLPGIAVTPVLSSSLDLDNQLSSGSLINVVLLGGVVLTLLSAVTISMGEKARLPTYGVVKYPFSEKRVTTVNTLMAISLSGWIAVTADMSGRSVHDLLAQYGLEVPLALLVTADCTIFVVSTAFGFAVLGKIAQAAVPVITLMLCYILYVATHTRVAVPATIVEMGTGVTASIVVGTITVLTVTLPGFGSFMHNRKHALIAVGVTFLVAYPLLYWMGMTPSAISDQGSLLDVMAIFGAALPAALLLVFVCVTGNTSNVFQGALVVSALLTRFPKWQTTVALGILSVIVDSMDIMAWFIPFLLLLSIATPPIAGIYVADFFLYRHNDCQESVLAQESQIRVLTLATWIVGVAVGFVTTKGLFTLATIPSVDSILVVCIAYAILGRASQHR